MNLGIVLAAGKGKRFKLQDKNKTSVSFMGKPLVCYAVDLMNKVSDKVIVVIGSQSKSVKEALKKEKRIYFVSQRKLLGTGHAVLTAVREIKKRGWKPSNVLVGYGDHMMFYTPEILLKLSREISREKDKVISMVTCDYDELDSHAFGRIIRDKSGNVISIIEQKDITKKERKIKEFNAGLYCFDYEFLKEQMKNIKKNKKSGEYYLTDLIQIAVSLEKKVVPVKVPFECVGIGINTRENFEESVKLFTNRNKKKTS